MRIKRLAWTTGALLVVAAVAMVVGLRVLAPRALAALSESVRANTGRELLFGDVGVRVLPHPTLVLQQARYGNAAWGSQPWLAQAGTLSVDIDLLSLLSSRLHIRRLAASNVSVLLETDAAGNGNWVIGAASAAARPAWLDTLAFDELSLQNVALRYRDGTSGRTAALRLERLDIAGPSALQPIRFSAGATLDGNKITATGTIGALNALLANSPAYPVDLEGTLGAASIGVHGTIDKPRGLEGLDLALRAQAPDLADVAQFGVNVPGGPFRGTARLTGSATAPVFTAVDLEFGTTQRMHVAARGDMHGSVAADGTRTWSSPGIDLVVEGGQFGDLADWIDRPLPPLGRYRIALHAAGPLSAPVLSAIEASAGGGEMPQINLSGAIADAHAVSGIDLEIAATAADWWRAGAAEATRLPPFRASARVRDSRDGYRIDDLDLRIADSSASAALRLEKSASRLRVTGNVKSPLLDLSRRSPARDKVPASVRGETSPARNFWKLADVDLDLNVRRIVLPDGRRIEQGSGKIALAGGRLQVSAMQGAFAGAKIRLDGSVSAPHQLAGLDLKVALEGNELAELLKSFGKTVAPVGPYQGRAELHGSPAALALANIDARAGRHGQSVQVSGQIDDALNWNGLRLALDANVGDSVAAGRLFGAELPRLPPWRGRARVTGPQGGYLLDDLDIELGRSSVRGRVAFAHGEPRPHLTATLGGPLLDLSALPSPTQKQRSGNPLLAADIDADVRFERVVLPDRRALGPVHGGMRLAAGVLQLKELAVAVDGANATFDGSIDDPLKFAGIALALDAKVERGAGIAALTGLRIPDRLPQFSAHGKLTDVPDGYALTGLELAFDSARVTSEASVLRGSTRFMLRATASAPMLDVSGLLASSPQESAAKPVAAGARAIPDVPLPLDALRAFDADLDLRIDALTFSDATALGPLHLRATIADGRLAADPVQVEAGAGRGLRASVTVDAARSAWTLQLDAGGIDLGEMFARFGLPKALTGGSTDLGLELRAHGKTLHALLASLNGTSHVKVGPLRVNNFAVGLGEGIVARLFSMANPFQKTDPDTEVKCVAGRLQVADGIVTSQNNVAVETAKYNLLMNGTVNLRTEGLDLAVTPVVTNGLAVGDVSTIVHLGGTLAAPTAGLTAAGAVKSMASLGATLTLPGVGQLVGSLFRKAMSDPNPCATALAQGTNGR